MFTITNRQYELIMHQAQSCYPQESGGILGGREDVILGILPIHNKFLYDRTGTFGMDTDDIDRGYQFLAKHKLDYYGIYHSHPKGIPYPSKEDLSHGQKFIFIVGLADRHNPGLYAWKVEGKEITQVPIKIVDEQLVEQMFLSPSKPKIADAAHPDEFAKLQSIIMDIVKGKVKYEKEHANKWDHSSFSTLA
ncbi:Mov34/MPN/PAD-1 family protein [Candidatus Margulisiibacteriota bacterium]